MDRTLTGGVCMYFGKGSIRYVFHHKGCARLDRGCKAISERVAHALPPTRGISVSLPTYTIRLGPHAPYSWARETRSAAKSLSFIIPSSSCVAKPTLTRASRTLAQLPGLWDAKSTPTLGP